MPLMSVVNDEGVREYRNDMENKCIYVDKTTLNELIKYQDITFKVLKGYYFNEGFNYTNKSVITNMYEKRLLHKLDHNPIEFVYKLILNSAYGKTIMKEQDSKNVFFNNKSSFTKYYSKNYNFIKSWVHIGNGKYKVANGDNPFEGGDPEYLLNSDGGYFVIDINKIKADIITGIK